MHPLKTGALIRASVMMAAHCRPDLPRATARGAGAVRRAGRPRLPGPGRHPRRRGRRRRDRQAARQRRGARHAHLPRRWSGLEAARARVARAAPPGQRPAAAHGWEQRPAWPPLADWLLTRTGLTPGRPLRTACKLRADVDRSDHYPLLSTIDSPGGPAQLPAAQLAPLADELRAVPDPDRQPDGRPLRRRPRHRRAHGRAALRLRHAPRPAGLGRRPPGLSAQGADGPARRLQTIKLKGGLAPFPSRGESEYDTFGVGHSSTSISAALGMALAAQPRPASSAGWWR